MLRGVMVTGAVLWATTMVFVCGYAYERLYLPWRAGLFQPQAAGVVFSQSTVLLGLLALALSHLWLLVVVGISVYQRQLSPTISRFLIGLMMCTLAMGYVPSPFWMFLTIKVLGPGPRGEEHLVRAAGRGDKSLTQLLLDQGVDINARIVNGVTALHAASSQGHDQIITLLLDRGADINARRRDCGGTPLIEASYGGHANAVKTLLSRGADPMAKDCNQKTAGAHATGPLVEAAFRAAFTSSDFSAGASRSGQGESKSR